MDVDDRRLKRRLQRIAASFNAKARKHHVPGVVTWEDLAAMPGFCRYCGIGLDLEHGTWDHYVAFDRGGNNWMTNIVRCCVTCQREKFTKTEAEHIEYKRLWLRCWVCDRVYKPRWAEYLNGRARVCSLKCAGKSRWLEPGASVRVKGPEG